MTLGINVRISLSMEENSIEDVHWQEDIPSIGVMMYVEMDIGITVLNVMVCSREWSISWKTNFGVREIECDTL